VKDTARWTTRARSRSRKAKAKRITASAPWTWRKPGAERIREDSVREGKDKKGGCVVNPMHHLDDSTTRARASEGRGGGTKPMGYEVVEAETLESA
jgi:hypothetical protein